MFVLSEKLREFRRRNGMTQEEVANTLEVAPQTVSKWERAETLPDVAMLPAIANLYAVTTDALLGMDQLHERARRGEGYTKARSFLKQKNWQGAIAVYQEALQSWPDDAGILTDMAMAMALSGSSYQLAKAAELCEDVLHTCANHKLQHTARAALCYIYAKSGMIERAKLAANQLPHMRESREAVMMKLAGECTWDAHLFELSVGEKMD